MNNKPLVSICITSYNHLKYIRQCIDSALGQTYPNIYVKVIDDASDDGTLDVLRSYGDKIDLTVKKINGGIDGYCPTINKSIRNAKGDYFYRLDSDDFIENDYIELMMQETAKDPSLDWVCGSANIVNADGEETAQWNYTDWPTKPDIARGFQTCSVLMPHNGIFRTKFLQENKLYWYNFPCGWGADVLFTIRAAQCNPNIKYIDKPGFNWRIHGANNSFDIEKRIRLILAVKEYYLENIPLELFLKNPIISSLRKESDEYKSAKYYLAASSLYQAKHRFRIPTVFSNDKAELEAKEKLSLFDDQINQWIEKSGQYSTNFDADLEKLSKQLQADQLTSEGEHCLKLDDFTGALQMFKEALQYHPHSIEALNGMVESCFLSGDIGMAELFCDQALALSQDNVQTLNNASVILASKGNHLNAEHTLLKSITIDPNNYDARINLLHLYPTLTINSIIDQTRRNNFLSSALWVSNNTKEVDDRATLMQENHFMRDKIIEQFANSCTESRERILLHLPPNGALKYLMYSWAEILNLMGIPTKLLKWGDDIDACLDSVRPSTFITVSDPAFIQQLDHSSLIKYRQNFNLKIGHITTLHHHFEPVDFYITFHLDPSRDKRFTTLDKTLLSLPFAINPNQHYMKPGREIWDYFFVGTNSHLKTDQTNNYLVPVLKNYNGILAGINWPHGIGEVPLQEAALMYNFASICPNYHMQGQLDEFNELNERTYIIPACGGFQLVDNPKAMSELFTTNEMAVANSPDEYLEMFSYYINNPEERMEYVRNGMKKVYDKYTLFHVLSRLTNYLMSQADNAYNKQLTLELNI